MSSIISSPVPTWSMMLLEHQTIALGNNHMMLLKLNKLWLLLELNQRLVKKMNLNLLVLETTGSRMTVTMTRATLMPLSRVVMGILASMNSALILSGNLPSILRRTNCKTVSALICTVTKSIASTTTMTISHMSVRILTSRNDTIVRNKGSLIVHFFKKNAGKVKKVITF